ncbi:MAG: protein TolQ [Candidatus Aminicenantes bacterium]|nr:protein TolQ [Candidatus Aminicenantes bacterium]
MNAFKLIAEASFVVQLILFSLLLFSVFSWAIILFKRRTLRQSSAQSKRFLSAFRKSRNLDDVNEAVRKYQASPLAAMFEAGFREVNLLAKRNPSGTPKADRMENIERALQRVSNAEIAKMERMMSFLATTGSVTPFIGLFGTVWGIMDAFQRIGVLRSASLVTVAPGIAEALIATAAGLFAAVPAVIAYNFFLHRIKDIITEMEDFHLEFLNVAERLYGP